jgi:hypothetical protein
MPVDILSRGQNVIFETKFVRQMFLTSSGGIEMV